MRPSLLVSFEETLSQILPALQHCVRAMTARSVGGFHAISQQAW